MARPARPDAEHDAVKAAAQIVRAETDLESAKAISLEIANRVTCKLMKEIEGDALELALIAFEQALADSPFQRLASCPEIDTASLFVERRIERLVARSGKFLTTEGQQKEREEIINDLTRFLACRYARCLRR